MKDLNLTPEQAQGFVDSLTKAAEDFHNGTGTVRKAGERPLSPAESVQQTLKDMREGKGESIDPDTL